MAIIVTDREKSQLEKENSLIRELPGASGSDKARFHNPVTGQEITAPIDAYHLTRRIKQGWRLGPAPAELQEKWIIREQELKELDDHRMEEYKNSDQGVQDQQAQAQNFSDAVATAVTQVLEKMGVNLEGQEAHQPQEEATEIDHDLQLPLFAPTDAPSESETKHEVSPASRPGLHLVEY